MDNEKLKMINTASDLVLLGILLLQQISGKSEAEVIEAIKAESDKTDTLLNKLK